MCEYWKYTTVMLRYICNRFWLTVPVLLLKALLMSRLPKLYQREVFWRDIPAWTRIGENAFRSVVLVLPILMPLRVAGSEQAIGLTLYCAGLILCFFSWGMQVWYSQTRWSANPWDFMAPAYTPLIWLIGIALIGDSLYASIPYKP